MRTLIEAKHKQIEELCKRYRVRKLELFGSAVSDRFDTATSDLDFLVEFDVVPPAEHAALLFRLAVRIDGSLRMQCRPGGDWGHPQPLLPPRHFQGSRGTLCGLKR